MALNTETRRSDFRPRRSVGVGDAAGGCNLGDKQTAPPALHQSERKPASPPPQPRSRLAADIEAADATLAWDNADVDSRGAEHQSLESTPTVSLLSPSRSIGEWFLFTL